MSDSFVQSKNIIHHKIGFIAYGSGSKSKVFEGTIQPQWKEKIKHLTLFNNLNNRTEIDVNTYENLHQFNLEQPVGPKPIRGLAYIEKEATNYGLRRYNTN